MSEKATTPPANSSWLRGRLNDIALAVGIVVALLGGMHLMIQLAVTPIHTRLDHMDTRFDRMDSETKGIRQDLAALSERVTRIETKLEAR